MAESNIEDDVVKNEILSTVSSVPKAIRTNKLRKTICQKLKSTNWDQFHRVLEASIQDGSIKTQTVDNEVVILSNHGKSDVQSLQSTNTAPVLVKKEKVALFSQDVEIPFPVYFHLYRKGQKKKKNIELNTKTSLECNNIDESDVLKNKHSIGTDDDSTTRTTTLTITKYRDDNGEKEEPTSEDEANNMILAKKQFQSAIYMTEKMVESYKKHPDHFAVLKAGGTFAEQDVVKKRKAAAAKKNKNKNKNKSSNNDHDENSKIHKAKKRSRKFY